MKGMWRTSAHPRRTRRSSTDEPAPSIDSAWCGENQPGSSSQAQFMTGSRPASRCAAGSRAQFSSAPVRDRDLPTGRNAEVWDELQRRKLTGPSDRIRRATANPKNKPIQSQRKPLWQIRNRDFADFASAQDHKTNPSRAVCGSAFTRLRAADRSVRPSEACDTSSR